ncbi:MAG: phage/plasmid primase, P4 family [Burkholderiaceae bacterium]
MSRHLTLVEPYGEMHPQPYEHQYWMAEARKVDQDSLIGFLKAYAGESPGPVERAQVLKCVKEIVNISLPTLRQQLQRFSVLPAQSDNYDHLDLCHEVLGVLGPENILRIGATTYHWDPIGIWRVANDRAINFAIQSHLKERGVEVSSSVVNSVADLLKNETYRADSPFEKQDDLKINCKNGTLVFEDGQWVLKAFHREDFFMSQIPVEYAEDATCPTFETFLGSSFEGDADAKDRALAVLQMLGYTLLRSCKFEKGILLVGSGANGKSVLLDLVEKLVGTNNIAGVQPENFDNRFQLGYLHGKLANVVTELPSTGGIPDGVLKQIVSGELITAEHKNQPPFDFRPYCTLWVGTNHLPSTKDASDALYRRFLVLRFNNQFPEGDSRRDPNLKAKLMKELPGILNYALDALAILLERGGFVQPASSVAEVKNWRHEQDPVKHFVDSACATGATAVTSFTDLYTHFCHFWKAEGFETPVMSTNLFSRRLRKVGFETVRGSNGNRKVPGICPREEGPL